MTDHVTPAYPPHAIQQARSWEQTQHQPVFAKAFAHSNFGCKNCGGDGIVYLSFCSDFLHDTARIVAVKKSVGEKGDKRTDYSAITYFEGNGKFGKGWYVIQNTAAYDCPLCGGSGK